ncbi:MAG: prolyl oligopeptidase family serine peptidase [Arenicella sp.]
MKNILYLILTLILGSTFSTPTLGLEGENYTKTQEDTSLADNMMSFQYKSGSDWINYRLHSPKKTDKGERYPLVLFLHGWGERGTDNIRHIKKAVPEMLTYAKSKQEKLYMIAPQFKENETWINGIRIDLVDSYLSPKEASYSIKLVIKLLKEFIENNPVDTDRVYVTGLSAGGFGTWDILVREPDLFAAAIPVAGGNAEDTAEAIKHIPLWVIHGEKDDVINRNFSRRSVAALKKAGGTPVYSEFKGMTHADPDWHFVYSNIEILDWLFSQRKIKH